MFEAFQPGAMGFAKRVAIKRLRPNLVAGDKRFLQSMINEARIGALLQHVNIVNILEFDQVAGHYYLAMEYVDGATLEEVIRVCQRRRVLLPRFAVVDLALQVCRGLQHAHEKRDHEGRHLELIHRDIKPSNIIVDREGTARILDFGIAKAATNLFNTTAPGLTKGTPRYMSPEQLRGAYPLLPRSDVFSTGVVLYELVTARPLFFGDSLAALLHQVVSGDITDRLDEAEAAFPGCRPILARALDRDADRRYPDARSMGADLRKLGQSYPSDAETADVIQALIPVLERPQRRRIADASELDHDDALSEADGFVHEEDLLGTRPIRPPPAGSSGWAEFTAALTAHDPVEFRDEEQHAYTLSQSALETVAPPGVRGVTQLRAPDPTSPEGREVLPSAAPTSGVAASPAPDRTPPPPRRTTWLYLLLAPAVVVAGFGFGVVVVALWSSVGGSVEVAPLTDEVTAETTERAPSDPGDRAGPADAHGANLPDVQPEVIPAPERDEPTPGRGADPGDISPPRATAEEMTPSPPAAEDRESTSKPRAASGTLSLYVRQWSRIYVDGVLVGNDTNSLDKVAVDGGRHEVKVVCGAPTCPCAGLEKRYRVRVDGDDVKLPHLDFEGLASACP